MMQNITELVFDTGEKLVLSIYHRVLRDAGEVLKNAKLFNIEVLQQENPTYSDIAEHLEEVCDLIDLLVQRHGLREHEWTATKARDYAAYVRRIAKAVSEDDEEKLNGIVEDLDKRSFL